LDFVSNFEFIIASLKIFAKYVPMKKLRTKYNQHTVINMYLWKRGLMVKTEEKNMCRYICRRRQFGIAWLERLFAILETAMVYMKTPKARP
jgi:hypothetical protein